MINLLRLFSLSWLLTSFFIAQAWDNSDYLQDLEIFGLTAFVGGSSAERASRIRDLEIENELLDALSALAWSNEDEGFMNGAVVTGQQAPGAF